MPNTISTEKVTRNILNQEWGHVAELFLEEGYAIKEFSVNPGQTLKLDSMHTNSYLIVASGSAEFDYNYEKKKIFKGDKLNLASVYEDSSTFEIKNCGVIPLVLIEVVLN